MPKIKDLNPSAIGRIGGADLAIPFKRPDGKIGYVWGDTFDGNVPAVNSGPDWRSPVITWADDTPVGRPINFTHAARGGAQLWPYQHNNPQFSTVLPCDALFIGGRIYLWVMVTRGLGNEIRCEIACSDDMGESWFAQPGGHYLSDGSPKWKTDFNGGKRTMVTWARGDDGWVYIISTGGLDRNKNAVLWRAPENALTDPFSWHGWQWNGSWGWGTGRADDILPPGTRLGEISLRRIQNYWVFSGFDAGAYSAFVKVGYGPIENINWHTAPTSYPVRGSSQEPGTYDVVDRLYGCYVHPSSRFENPDGTPGAFSMIVSTWAVSGNPYRAMQYRIPTPAAIGPVADRAGVATEAMPPSSSDGPKVSKRLHRAISTA
ncbi:DUF4185 domain-containing protein [Nocardia sp. NBC_01329]|uniref:DUF4185 domain-containing protein n=1 Tax=Nocardia sp. NBC_01329 TaxID=2903594 RepID=UPI002E0D3BF9|nr:DUF4185 domain-containing protein [Nocardia sp. NBC_01329]